jgi:hypothetical protein
MFYFRILMDFADTHWSFATKVASMSALMNPGQGA